MKQLLLILVLLCCVNSGWAFDTSPYYREISYKEHNQFIYEATYDTISIIPSYVILPENFIKFDNEKAILDILKNQEEILENQEIILWEIRRRCK